MEKKSESEKSSKVILDVEKENTIAIKFYKKLGYEKTSESTVKLTRQQKVNFFRMKRML